MNFLWHDVFHYYTTKRTSLISVQIILISPKVKNKQNIKICKLQNKINSLILIFYKSIYYFIYIYRNVAQLKCTRARPLSPSSIIRERKHVLSRRSVEKDLLAVATLTGKVTNICIRIWIVGNISIPQTTSISRAVSGVIVLPSFIFPTHHTQFLG